MDIWVTSSGKKIPVTCMKDSHLANAIKMVQRIITKPGERAHYLDKLRMLTAEKNRRLGIMDKYVWCKAPTGEKAHQVMKHVAGHLDHVARCGVRQRTANWTEYPGSSCEMDRCQRCLAIIAEESKVAEPPKESKMEVEANFLQVVGPEIPLCWIPVSDVKAVVMLLATHRPIDALPLSQAQFDSTIGHLNKYIDEAMARNTQSTFVTTWTHPGEKQKDK